MPPSLRSSQLELLSDTFSLLPLYFLNFHSHTSLPSLLSALRHAVYAHDAQHVILDNLQFMLPHEANMFQAQDRAITEFRRFATENDVHVTLVCHPRKEAAGEALGISSFFGSAKATQEADNVVILQHDARGKRLEVKKNR